MRIRYWGSDVCSSELGWAGARDATRFGPACMQPGPRGPSIYAWDLPAMSEDCLSLNIWAPKDAKNAPVFVWIHGGALTGGSGGDPIYDGSALAERGIVVVRSEERRVGKEGCSTCRTWWSPDPYKKKNK